MKNTGYTLLILILSSMCLMTYAQTTKTVGGTGANYASLNLAFNAINAGTITGAITLQITGSTIETASVVLNASGSGSANYSSVTIYPTLPGISISGNFDKPLIDLDGADQVTIDGRVNATGTTKDLIITNQSVSGTNVTSTIRLINSAESNTVKYCNVKGSQTGNGSGIIFFSNASSGNGNDGNTIANNNITNDSGNRPINVIYSSGSGGHENSGNNIINNYIYDFLNDGKASQGILLFSFTTAWSISGNSFYETTSFAPTANVNYHAIIRIDNNLGTGFIVTNNFIGGSSMECAGTWTKTNSHDNIFEAISLNVGTGVASSIQNNSIKNIIWSNSSNAVWTAIDLEGGDIDVGTVTGNTIGAPTGTGSIVVIYKSNGAVVTGINIVSTGSVNCQNNIISSVTAGNVAANSTKFYGINKNANGTTTISNNTIGSKTTANSIEASSTSTGSDQYVYGIYNAGTGTITLNSNTVANLTNRAARTNNGQGLINGITSVNGTNIITNNTIHDLTIANQNNKVDHTASVCGIALSAATLRTVTGNSIYNLSNTFASYDGAVIGLYFEGDNVANTVSGNFIHSLFAPGASTTVNAGLYGIKISSGTTTYSNNIIVLGGNRAITLYGIYETGAAGTVNNLYFNTVYIGGSLISGTTSQSYALYSAVKTNTRNFRNNIFDNARSTTGGINMHYALFLNYNATTLLTLNYNDYRASGSGGMLGSYNGANIASLPLAPLLDANSLTLDPGFALAGGTTPTNYIPNSLLAGISIGSITTDYSGNMRGATPTIGAWERSIINKWKGTTSNNWNTTSNWSLNMLPAVDANILFDDAPLNHCQLDQNRSVTDITNAQSIFSMVTNGFKLTVKGNFNFTNGAQINALATNSIVEFAGTAPQFIQPYIFYGNQANQLTIDNGNGVTMNTDFVINNNLLINSGKLFVLAAGKSLTVSGTITNLAGTAGLILQSGVIGTASLLHNTNNVLATVERYINGASEYWHFLSSPVSAQIIGDSWLPAGTYGNGTGYDLYLWNEPNNCWIYKLNITSLINWNTVHPDQNFLAGRGYLYSVKETNPTKVFSGNLNNGTVSYAMTSNSSDLSLTGFNLVGNPYPSSIDWSAATGWTRSNLVASGAGYDMWIWNPTAVNYGVCNSNSGSGTNGVTSYIAPMQGYFVRAAGAGNLVTGNAVRLHTGAGDWKNGERNPDRLDLVVQSSTDNSSDEVRLQFGFTVDQTGTAKLFSPVATAPSLYFSSDRANFTVQYLTNKIDHPLIPVMFKPGSDGYYTLKCNFDSNNFETVLLEDRQSKTLQDMKANPLYAFNALKTDDANRFYLHFNSQNNLSDSQLPATIYSEGPQLIVDLIAVPLDTDVIVYDVIGRKLFQQKLAGGIRHTLNFNAGFNISLVSLQNPNGTLCRKIMVMR